MPLLCSGHPDQAEQQELHRRASEQAQHARHTCRDRGTLRRMHGSYRRTSCTDSWACSSATTSSCINTTFSPLRYRVNPIIWICVEHSLHFGHSGILYARTHMCQRRVAGSHCARPALAKPNICPSTSQTSQKITSQLRTIQMTSWHSLIRHAHILTHTLVSKPPLVLARW